MLKKRLLKSMYILEAFSSFFFAKNTIITNIMVNSVTRHKDVSRFKGDGAGWAGWAFAHPVFREQNRKPLNVPTSKALK